MYKKLTTILLTLMLGLGTLSLTACGNDDSADQSGQKSDGSDSVAEHMQKQADEQKKKDQSQGNAGGSANSNGGTMEQGADNAQNSNDKANQDMKNN